MTVTHSNDLYDQTVNIWFTGLSDIERHAIEAASSHDESYGDSNGRPSTSMELLVASMQGKAWLCAATKEGEHHPLVKQT